MKRAFLALASVVIVGCGRKPEPAPEVEAAPRATQSATPRGRSEQNPPLSPEIALDENVRPVARSGHELVYHDKLKMALLVNGAEDEGPKTKIWGWDGRRWKMLAADGPQPRGLGGVAYDAKRDLLILYGGRSLKKDHTDMWNWDGKRWEKINTTAGSVSNHFFMLRDPDRDRIVLFSGQEAVADPKSHAKVLRDTWEWDGQKWAKVSATGPTERAHYALAYDSARRQTLLFGGGSNDFWKWDGSNWRALKAVPGPSPRWGVRMAFDAGAKKMVLFGGRPSGSGRPKTPLDDTWLWDGVQWSQATVPGPSNRSHHAMTYDPIRKKVILFGGFGENEKDLGDTWEWDGTRWTMADMPTNLNRGNPQRTGVYDVKPLRKFAGVRWSQSVGPSSLGSPVCADGVVYVGAQDGRLHAIDAKTGATRWATRVDKFVFSPVAVADGKVYVGGNSLHVLDAESGKWLWSINTPKPVWTAPLIVGKILYFASQDGTFQAFDLSSSEAVWQLETGRELVFAQPAFADGTIYFSAEKTIYAVDALTGKERWKVEGAYWNVLAAAQGKVFAGNTDCRFYALDGKTGKTLWTFQGKEDVWSAPVITGDTVVVGNRDGHLHALEIPTGKEKWKFKAEDWMVSDPIFAVGVIFAGCGNHQNQNGPRHLYALDAATGKELWRFRAAGRLLTSPAIADEAVFVVTIDGLVYGLR